jgi:DNA replication protein DnaC
VNDTRQLTFAVPTGAAPAPAAPGRTFWKLVQPAGDTDALIRAERCRNFPFADTSYHRLPDQTAHNQAMAWRPGNVGMRLIGPSGSGKTRTAWEVVRKTVRSHGCRVIWYDWVGWTNKVAETFGDAEHTEDWLESLSTVALLFLDDVFTGAPTDAQCRALFAIVDRRRMRRLPTLLTIQSADGASVYWGRDGKQADPDMWAKTLSRLVETTDRVMFAARQRG